MLCKSMAQLMIRRIIFTQNWQKADDGFQTFAMFS